MPLEKTMRERIKSYCDNDLPDDDWFDCNFRLSTTKNFAAVSGWSSIVLCIHINWAKHCWLPGQNCMVMLNFRSRNMPLFMRL